MASTSTEDGGQQNQEADANSSDDVNPYLALREAKIKRNQERLRALGLLSSKPQLLTQKRRPDQNSRASPRTKEHDPPPVLRRSGRISRRPSSHEPSSSSLSSLDPPAGREYRRSSRKRPLPAKSISSSETSDAATTRAKPTRRSSPGPRSAPAANSVRGISLDTGLLVLGIPSGGSTMFGTGDMKSEGGVLGRPMERTGKEFVVYEAFERAASPDDRRRLEDSRLSFNKYSGVQEWQDCIFLWVNLGGPSSSGGIVNEFLEDGRRITWFGGSRMIEETPVVQKLLQWGKAAATSTGKGTSIASKLVLWCRSYDAARKAFGPYVCLGRLAYDSHEPESYPLTFTWKLLDSERLMENKDAQIRTMFNGLVRMTR